MAALLEAAKRRNPLPTGTAAVGVGLMVAGISAYGFLVLADKALSKAEYSPLAALWSLVFLAGPGLFLPLEQEISRALAERRARNQGGLPVVRRAATIGVGLGLGVLILLIATARLTVDHLFDGQILLLVGLALGLAGALAGHLTRGCLSGTGRFKGYSVYLGADGFLRVLGAAACILIGVNTAGPFGVAVGIAGLLAVPVALLVQRPELDEGPEAAFAEVGSALGLLLVSSICAFAIMNIGPVVVKRLADESQNEAAGRFVNGVIVARIPLFLFQAVQASLLPKLSALAHSGHLGDFRVGLKRLLIAVGGLALAGSVGGDTRPGRIVEQVARLFHRTTTARTARHVREGARCRASVSCSPPPSPRSARSTRPPPTTCAAGRERSCSTCGSRTSTSRVRSPAPSTSPAARSRARSRCACPTTTPR